MNKRNWIRSVLRSRGEITRNQALQNYCSRLAADIDVIRPEFPDHEIVGEDVKTPYGKDYRYRLKAKDALF